MKEEQHAANAAQVTPPAQHLTTTEHAAPTQQAGTSQHASTSSLCSLLVGQKVPNQRSLLTNAVKRLVSPSKTKPSLVHAHARPKPHLIQLPVSFEAAKAPASTLTHLAVSSEVDDSTLLAEAVQFEEANPAGVQLYAQTGSSVKGGHRLPTYRCARGSTSLESFHLHLNRFIPGTLASDTFFQAYLLDGLARWNEDRAVAATRDEQQHPHCYNHLLRHAVNTLAEEVLGKKIIPYVGPRKYTEELLGVEYFLFGLPEHLLALSGDECGKIIILWQALGDFDKRKTIYPPRHKNTLKQGRFRATKNIVAPGVESTKRCFIGAHSPAQWPDCNRVVEAIFTRLCDLYKNSVRCEGKRVSRFTMVIRAYKHIRECVITNAKVMTETTIQLPEVNIATVTQWFSRRCRSQEQQVLEQGIPAPDAPMAGPEQLLVAKQKGTSLFPGSLAEPHTFVLPPNTAGEAKLQKRSQPVAISQVPPPPPCYALPFLAPTPPFSTPYMMVPYVQLPQVPGSSQMMLLNMPLPSAAQALTSGQSNVPYTTQQYRKRKEEREQSGSGKRKYVKKTQSFAKSATKTGSHQPTYSTLEIGTVKNPKPSPIGGLCWSKEGMGKKERG
ncbi:hypothetical protein CesoFtcFv8_001849 [Champsocephalus esox]|uniref:Uncharacterized protein n=1 Tax=Champsocephalus esox TaxID=159716 RepID=A0AAN8D2Z1_9TELE|nr:hypothetical protein CesoFtcFv8_001849 [Champsocephalus esox]